MTSTEGRWLLLTMFSRLTRYAEDNGMKFIVTCFYRDPMEQARLFAAGRSKVRHSQHQDWLAMDLALLGADGVPIWAHARGDHYEMLGAFWEGLSPHLRWGGNFARTEEKLGWDPYHFEVFRGSIGKGTA